jgi:hypothetical protein
LLVSARFQVFSLPARGAFHLSLSVLLHYRSPVVFSLGRWSARIQPEFLVLRPTWVSQYGESYLSPTGLSPPAVSFPNTVRLDITFVTPLHRCGSVTCDPSTPVRETTAVLHAHGLGSSPFAHHYSGNLLSISLPPATEMFHFAGFPPPYAGDWSSTSRVSPFGHLRFNGCLRLTEAFRSLPRPSSATGA